jgi:hypothetical protein
MVYADGSNPSVRKDIGVRLPSPAPQPRSARLAVAPRHVDDPPALPRLQELEKINVERAPNGGARDAIRYVVDYDIDPAIVDVLSLPHTARGHLDHLSSRDRADAFSARGVVLERALGQLRMKRSLHPRAVPIEPSLDVVTRRALDRRFVAGCGFFGPDGIRLAPCGSPQGFDYLDLTLDRHAVDLGHRCRVIISLQTVC